MINIKRITDDKLQLRNLKYIRAAYIVQTIGIILILIHQAITSGVDVMTKSPLWWLFRISTTILLFSIVSTSIERDKRVRSPRRFIISWLIFSITITVLGVVLSYSHLELFKKILLGIFIFIILAAPGLYIYYLLKEKINNNQDE